MRRGAVASAMVAMLLLAGCKTELNHGLTQHEANDIVALLLHSGIPASREMDPKDHTTTVFVEQDRFADAVDIINAHGLPRDGYASIPEIFKGSGLVASPVEERARLIYALGESLSRSIAEIDGVLSARVHIVLPDNDPLQRDAPPSSASVLVRYTLGTAMERLTPQIKQLVANGVAGLSYDKVSVVLVPAAVTAKSPADPANELVSVAGIWVQRGSALLLQAVLTLGAAALAACAGLIGWLLWRQRSGAGALAAR